jgi:hypothetical protein
MKAADAVLEHPPAMVHPKETEEDMKFIVTESDTGNPTRITLATMIRDAAAPCPGRWSRATMLAGMALTMEDPDELPTLLDAVEAALAPLFAQWRTELMMKAKG